MKGGLHAAAAGTAALVLLGVLGVLGALGAPGAAGGAAQRDPRSTEVLSRECFNDLGRETVTLFANGTIRLHTDLRTEPGTDLHRGVPERRERQTWLAELGVAEYQAFFVRLRAEQLREVEGFRRSVVGEWVERCELRLLLDEHAPADRYAWSRYDALPLGLQRVLAIADELGRLVDRSVPAIEAPRLPADYQPRVGDVLRRADGQEFRIVAFTDIGGGVELVGREQPITLYLQAVELRRLFVALVSR